MDHRFFSVLFLGGMLGVVAVSPPCQAADGGESQADRIERLVEQLGSAKYRDRQAAHNKLRDLDSSAALHLKRLLDRGGLSPEARQRLRHLYNRIWVPRHGVVWVGRFDREPPGTLRKGDVVTAVDGKKVRNGYELVAMDPNDSSHTLTV